MADSISEAVARHLPAGPLCVALSGGLDSTVLLHVLASSAARPLRAIHVDHGIHPDSARWAAHCAALCARLGVEFTSVAVVVSRDAGAGLEAEARRVRYEALGQSLREGEVLATAHHRDDQAETLLLNLMRGSGVAGLAGASRLAPFARGLLWRPLLDVPRAALLAYGRSEGLDWIEDPSNADLRLDRNFLRHAILPALSARWPGAAAAIARSARLSGDAAALIEELARQDAGRLYRGGRIALPALAALSDARRRNVLRFLCRRETGAAPGESRLREGLAQLLDAPPDRAPLLSWPGGEIRRYRSSLYLVPAASPGGAPEAVLPARSGARIDLGAGFGSLRLRRGPGPALDPARLAPSLAVRWRSGGERLRPAGDRHERELKKLLQERGVVPWMRDRIPLLYSGDALVAVADLWLVDGFATGPDGRGLRVRWESHPPID